MTDRPIIFSGPMVRALLEGRKTQTRRLATSPLRRAVVGDRLWVREGFHATDDFTRIGGLFGYQQPGSDREFEVPGVGRVREFQHHLGGWGGTTSRNYPSIHMPRWASRLTLVVTDVLFQPLHDISREDAEAEGIEGRPFHWRDYLDERREAPSPISSYRSLWASLHGTESLHANPEVVAIAFTVEHTCPAKA